MSAKEVYQLDALDADLKELHPPARLAVLGHPVAHSRSPQMHQPALAAAGIDAQYIRIDVPPERLGEAFEKLRAAGFVGANLTIPLKQEAVSLVSDLDEAARLSRSVNTVLFDGDTVRGYSTDGAGFVRAIREAFWVDVRDLRVMILGAGGGAGRALAVQCAMERCSRLVLVNRTVEKVQALEKELSPFFRSDRLLGPTDRMAAIGFEVPRLQAELEYIDLVVNATSLGMKRSDPPVLPSSLIHPALIVYDTVYASGKSRLLEDAQANGARTGDGLSMLLHQGALAFEIWFNRDAPLEAMRTGLYGTAS